ncbi:hypothetical protein L596_002017 [Steinernema carpocapsae]|uniref:Uncharacterized protein n=1 Tax=Steinernema carpocapsae TaxID=34508 RepID=A0A4U8UMU1_STECR|nr:hypothetical protein L596_002017 [Steinernema carpocapsae]
MRTFILLSACLLAVLAGSVVRTKRQCLCPQQTQACACSNQYYPQPQYQPQYAPYQTYQVYQPQPQYVPSYQPQGCQPACQEACTQNCNPSYPNQCQPACQQACTQACTAVQSNCNTGCQTGCSLNCVNQPQPGQPGQSGQPQPPFSTTPAPWVGPQNPQEQQECRSQCVQSCLEQQQPQQKCEQECEEMCRLPTPPPPSQETLRYEQPNLNQPGNVNPRE